MKWTREEILSSTGGEMIRRGKQEVYCGVVTDSRETGRGSVFIALEGERLDGHAFLGDALRRGAGCLVVHKRTRVRGLQGASIIRVPDTLQALGDMARYWRHKTAPKVLAITGSNGKTTTKEMVAAIVERASMDGRRLKGKVLKTVGNYNNLVGLPLTLLGLTGKEKVAVVELGTSLPGEIRRLTEIADPDIALITSIGPAHLTGLGSLNGVAREKGDIFRRMSPVGTAIVNLDDPWTRRLGRRVKGKKITYGRSGSVRAERARNLGEKGMEFTLRVKQGRRRVRCRLSGEHNLANALGAAAMAFGLGVDLKAMGKGLESVKPVPMRMSIERVKGVGIINDAYNANPASMEAALTTLMKMGGRGERIAILGDMLELGRQSERIHRELGELVAHHGVDRLYLLGRFASQVKKGALCGGMADEQIRIGKNHRMVAQWVRSQTRRGDWLLLKGSRAMTMEKVLAALKSKGD